MKGSLIDTNVLSELRKEQRCDAGVRQWFEEAGSEQLFISTLTLGEIRRGIEQIRRRDPSQAKRRWRSGCCGWRPNLPNECCQWMKRIVADQMGQIGFGATRPDN